MRWSIGWVDRYTLDLRSVQADGQAKLGSGAQRGSVVVILSDGMGNREKRFGL